MVIIKIVVFYSKIIKTLFEFLKIKELFDLKIQILVYV